MAEEVTLIENPVGYYEEKVARLKRRLVEESGTTFILDALGRELEVAEMELHNARGITHGG